MIDTIEIGEVARANGVPASTIERDYVQNWFLKGLYSKERGMIFKGGTAIRKAHINNYRFSDDLDFTLIAQMEETRLKDIIEECAHFIRDEVNVNVEDRISLEQNENGWVGNIYFRLMRKTGSPLKIKLDISNAENEILLTPSEKLPVFHNYSDEYDATVEVYSLREIVAEKARVLFQRVRSRDLYDVHRLWQNMEGVEVRTLFLEKCKFKEIVPKLSHFIAKEKNYKGAWESSLRHQMKDLPDFDGVFEETRLILERLGAE
ncbi:MAG: nucleotidyl transferase AbiEii/AbiGii toxin family protein [Thermoplasmata archaeon]|nr:nucleotidyl transferase AbiEii/AbiGii toxin family protein [Thermoplasmata archaeon]